jgi:hypothetical protein
VPVACLRSLGRRLTNLSVTLWPFAVTSAASAGVQQAFWLAPQDGAWSDPTRSPGNFDVFVNPTGTPYTITAATVRVDNVTINSPDATVLYQFDNDFAVNGVLAINAGTFALGGSGALVDATVRTAGTARSRSRPRPGCARCGT